MKKKLALFLAVIILTTSIQFSTVFGQRFDLLREGLHLKLQVYHGVDEENEEINGVEEDAINEKAEKLIKDNDAGVRREYPMFAPLVQHMREALADEVKVLEACLCLEEAYKIHEAHRAKGFSEYRRIMRSYKDLLGISVETIDQFYESDYSKFYKIIKGEGCDKFGSVDEPEPIEPQNPDTIVTPIVPQNKKVQIKTVLETSDGSKYSVGQDTAIYASKDDDYGASNIIVLLRELLTRGLIKTEYLELTQLHEGHEAWVPGVNGVPYEVTFRHSDTKKIFYYPPSEYVINSSVTGDFWNFYKHGLDDFSKLVLNILDQYGGGSFQILCQGKADKPTFAPKTLKPGYAFDIFSEIELLRVDWEKKALIRDTVFVGNKYDNDELPDLRGVFMKYALGKVDGLRTMKHKIKVLKGRVTDDYEIKDRNCTIVIFIDWEEATRFAEDIEKGVQFGEMKDDK